MAQILGEANSRLFIRRFLLPRDGLAGTIRLNWGARPVSVAVFGVSPNTRLVCTLSLIGETAPAPRSVGETPTGATGTGRARALGSERAQEGESPSLVELTANN